MSYQAEVFNVLIASPSDVATEREEVERAIYEWNRRYSAQLNVVLLPRRWEKDVVPAYRGADPQQIINEQITQKCHILIGIFWTKLGTATLNHSSGTLEEINLFIEAEKDVLLFFVDKPVPRSNTDYSAKLGWLCTQIREALQRLIAARKTSRGCTIAAFKEPTEMISLKITRFLVFKNRQVNCSFGECRNSGASKS